VESFRFRKSHPREGRHRNPQLAASPISTRYVRILMSESSNTCDEHDATDPRNCVGYAIQQIELGTIDPAKIFVPVAKSPAEPTTNYTASSIDPWHSTEDARDGGDYQHAGFDLFFTSGITNNLPAMIPSPCSTARPTMPPRKSLTSKSEATRLATSKWEKSPMANTPCPKITPRFTSSGPTPSTESIQN